MANLAADLDDRLRALERELEHLAADRQSYADLFSYAPEACVVTDASGTILDANLAAVRLLRGEGELRGKPIDAWIPLEQRRVFRASVIGAVASTERARFPGKLRFREGDVAVELSVSVVRRARAPMRLLWLLRPLS